MAQTCKEQLADLVVMALLRGTSSGWREGHKPHRVKPGEQSPASSKVPREQHMTGLSTQSSFAENNLGVLMGMGLTMKLSLYLSCFFSFLSELGVLALPGV